MAGVGGYQRPTNPAPVSGPGAASQRTDGQPGTTPVQAARYISGQDYGEGKIINAQQTAAPMAAAVQPGDTSGMPMPQTISSAPMPIGLNEPTQNPNEPVTSGLPFGPGSNISPVPQAAQNSPQDIEKAQKILAMLSKAAEQSNASDATRNMVRRLRGSL